MDYQCHLEIFRIFFRTILQILLAIAIWPNVLNIFLFFLIKNINFFHLKNNVKNISFKIFLLIIILLKQQFNQ